MEVTCPKCQGRIATEDVNVARDVAFCRACNEAFALSDVVAEDFFDEVDVNDMPRGVSVEDYGVRVTIRASTRRLGWALFWSLFAFGFGLAVPIGVIFSEVSKGSAELWPFLFVIPFAGVGVFAWYMLLMHIIGRVEVTVDGSLVTIFTGVGSLGRTKTGDWSAVRRVGLADSGVRENGRPVSCLVLEGESPLKFGTLLPDRRKHYVGGVVEQLLKRRDRGM